MTSSQMGRGKFVADAVHGQQLRAGDGGVQGLAVVVGQDRVVVAVDHEGRDVEVLEPLIPRLRLGDGRSVIEAAGVVDRAVEVGAKELFIQVAVVGILRSGQGAEHLDLHGDDGVAVGPIDIRPWSRSLRESSARAATVIVRALRDSKASAASSVAPGLGVDMIGVRVSTRSG